MRLIGKCFSAAHVAMKAFVITHSYRGDGAAQMLLETAAYWTGQLGWQVDAVEGPRMSGVDFEAIAQSGMKPIKRAQFTDHYDLALVNCVANLQFVDLIHPHVPVMLWAHEAET